MAGLSKDESEDLAPRAGDAELRADFERMRKNSSARAEQASFEAHIHWLDEVNAGLGHPKRKSEPIIGATWILRGHRLLTACTLKYPEASFR